MRAMSHLLNQHAHATGRDGDDFDGSVQVGCVEIVHFGFGDFLKLGTRDLADLGAVRRGRERVRFTMPF